MGNLILSGGGSSEQNHITHQFLVKTVGKDKPILYIPLAGDANYRPHYKSLEYIKSSLEPFGIKEVTMWTDLNLKTVEELKCFSAIYFSGGSTLTLLKSIKESDFDKVLIKYLKSGGTIFGQSAGAKIFGRGVFHTTTEKYHSLNLLKYRLWCHYHRTNDEELREQSIRKGDPIIAIADGGAIHVTDTGFQVISKEVYEFKDGERKVLKKS